MKLKNRYNKEMQNTKILIQKILWHTKEEKEQQ